MSDQPRLKVPILSFVDKTPTPTRLLKAVDEIGLQLDSAKSTASSSNNPFDEHFRKALSSSKKVDDLSESEEKKEPVDDMLNTPLILQDIQSAPPSATVIPLPDRASAVTSSRTTRKFKPIVPMTQSLVNSTMGSSAAQLLLKMPSGSTIQLSQIPFIKERTMTPTKDMVASTPISKKRQKQEGTTKAISESDKVDLKARNRAAASRSRNKKKKVTEGFQRQIQILVERNKQLVQENLVLKKEVVQLKNQISVNKTTAARPVIITLDQGYAPVQQQ